ncbi:MAG TPA: helix-turn-helix domain-containing protein, partial [Kofleriaceae bacterium]|nr:helix-turn-helix domain-containing protein [Kofleriaceae bacterium]
MAIVDPGERAKQERRRQIMAAAKDVFAEAGYHGASINSIIERAQIARGTFYLYFESKAAVFDAILDRAMADLRARIHRIEVGDPSAPPPQVQLRAQV